MMTPGEFCLRVNDAVAVMSVEGYPGETCKIAYAMELDGEWYFVGLSAEDADADPRPSFVNMYEEKTGVRPEGWAAHEFKPIMVDYGAFDLTRDIGKSLLPKDIVIPHFH